MTGVEFWIEGDGSKICVGDGMTVEGATHIACIEGCDVAIGEDCMFLAGITIRTGDSHSIIDAEEYRINPSESVFVDDHVWIGNGVTILKGSSIPANSIVGAQSVVTKSFDSTGSCIVGSPARVVRTGVSWLRERI